MATDSRAAVFERLGEVPRGRRSGPIAGLLRFARTNPLGAFAGMLLVAVVCVAIFAPVIAPYKPDLNHANARLLRPSSTYILGTDQFGRDVFSRIVYGARVSLEIGALSTAIAVLLSASIGVSAAYFRGWWDFITSRVIDVVQALPALVLLLTLLAALGRSLASVAIVLGLTIGIIGSRVIRGAALGIANQQYVEVARSIGCRPGRILLRYVGLNVVPLVIVLATINIGAVIVAEASLSFLGFGVPPPSPSWGGMLSKEGRQYMVQSPWLFIAPTATLAIVVFCVNMLGDALRDRLDPRLRGG